MANNRLLKRLIKLMSLKNGKSLKKAASYDDVYIVKYLIEYYGVYIRKSRLRVDTKHIKNLNDLKYTIDHGHEIYIHYKDHKAYCLSNKIAQFELTYYLLVTYFDRLKTIHHE